MKQKDIRWSERKSAMSRRAFISSSVTTAGSVSLLKPSTVFGTAANSKVEIGVVGLGGRGAWIADFFRQHGGYALTSVADYFPEVANNKGQSLGVDPKRCFSGLLGYKRLIGSGVDAVALETPPWFFPHHARAAVDAGCHVYMAKPVAVDVPGCLDIAELAKRSTKNNKCFLVDFQTRTDPNFQESVRRVHAGALGKITTVFSHYLDEGFADPPHTQTIESRLRHLIWVNDVNLGGSYLVNAGIHALDVALWIIGKTPLRASGFSRRMRANPHGDSRDVYSLSFEFPDDIIVNHRGEHIKNMSDFQCGCIAYGYDAFMEGNYAGKSWLRGGKLGFSGGGNPNLYADGAKSNIDTFHKDVTQGRHENLTAEPSVNSALFSILGREAGKRNGEPMTWDELLKDKTSIPLDLSGLKE